MTPRDLAEELGLSNRPGQRHPARAVPEGTWGALPALGSERRAGPGCPGTRSAAATSPTRRRPGHPLRRRDRRGTGRAMSRPGSWPTWRVKAGRSFRSPTPRARSEATTSVPGRRERPCRRGQGLSVGGVRGPSSGGRDEGDLPHAAGAPLAGRRRPGRRSARSGAVPAWTSRSGCRAGHATSNCSRRSNAPLRRLGVLIYLVEPDGAVSLHTPAPKPGPRVPNQSTVTRV